MKRDLESGKETEMTSHRNAAFAVRWLTPTMLIYRVQSSSENADYIVSVDGGNPRRLTDVSMVPAGQ